MAPIKNPKASTNAATTPFTESKSLGASLHTNADTTMAEAATTTTAAATAQHRSFTSPQDLKKRKRKEKESHILHQTTFRKPTWSYFHLALITPGTAAQPPSTITTPTTDPRPDIDALTVSTLLSHPLTAYLGTTGAAIPLDILHTQGRDVFVRVARQDARGFRAGLSGWVGGCDAGSVPGVVVGEEGRRVSVAWRVVSEGGSLGMLGGDGGMEFGEVGGVAY